MNEASLFDHNEFVTLTYDDEHLPQDHQLEPRDLQLFIKRLRKHFHPRHITYFASGEYGDEGARPHYHAIIFNCRFEDRIIHKRTKSGHLIYTSRTLSKLWKLGFADTGDVTLQSAQYVARYTIKKCDPDFDDRYQYTHPDTGELINRRPEFGRMSTRPAIGRRWLEKYVTDVYTNGLMVANGYEQRPPRYYDKLHQKMRPTNHRRIQMQREQQAREKMTHDNTNSRLQQKETVKKAELNQTNRKTN